MWNCHRSTDNRYSGDNRLIGLESSHRQPGLAPQIWGGTGVILCMHWLITVEPSHMKVCMVIPWEVLKSISSYSMVFSLGDN